MPPTKIAEDKATLVTDGLDSRYRSVGTTLLVAVIISQWICLLAVIEPNAWFPATLIARCICALFLLGIVIPTLFIFIRGLLGMYAPHPKARLYLLWYFVVTATHIVAVAALFLGRLDVALLTAFGCWAMEAIRKSILPIFPSEELNKPLERKQLISRIFSVVFFVLLVASIHLRSLPLANALFISMLIQQTVLFTLRFDNKTERK